jgi:hypothetical protein
MVTFSNNIVILCPTVITLTFYNVFPDTNIFTDINTIREYLAKILFIESYVTYQLWYI